MRKSIKAKLDFKGYIDFKVWVVKWNATLFVNYIYILVIEKLIKSGFGVNNHLIKTSHVQSKKKLKEYVYFWRSEHVIR